jgi:NDP-sugar pyrophosphorylase family protein
MEPEVVILCGGKGVRSHSFTEYFPKVMMPINGTPILLHLMRIYASQGFSRFVLVAGYRKEMLFDYFEGRFQNWSILLPHLASRGLLSAYKHLGFWKSMDTSNEQQELEKLCLNGKIPWSPLGAAVAMAAR